MGCVLLDQLLHEGNKFGIGVVLDVSEVALFPAQLVAEAEHPKHDAFTARLQNNCPFALSDHQLGGYNNVVGFHGVADVRERVLTYGIVGGQIRRLLAKAPRLRTY